MPPETIVVTTNTFKPLRRWFQFSLRSLLVFTLLAGVGLGWVAKERRQSEWEKRIGKKLEEYGLCTVIFGGPFDSLERSEAQKPQGVWRELARNTLGSRALKLNIAHQVFDKNEFFNLIAELKSLRVVAVSRLGTFSGPMLMDLDKTSVADLKPFANLHKLESLHLESVPVEDMSAFRGLKRLSHLSLSNTLVTDLSPLSNLTNLQEISFRRTSIPLANYARLAELSTDKTKVTDLSPLHQLKNLRKINLQGIFAADKDIDALQKALPRCKIDR